MSAAQTIRRARFRAPPAAVAQMLVSLSQYQPAADWPRDCRALADQVADTEPFAIILFTEPLAPEHWRRRSHTLMRRIETGSELDQTVWRHFDAELNTRMAEWLRDHRDPDDVHLRSLVRQYHPKARAILRAEYEERYPRAWKRRWAERTYLRPRYKVECRRRYDLPPPLGLWGTDAPQQFYFMRRSGTYARGCSTSSGSREVHSYYGLAFLELTLRGLSIPCHILVYDKHNQLCLADTLPSFALHAGAMGSNCDEPQGTVRTLMQTARTVRVIEADDGCGIREVQVMAPRTIGINDRDDKPRIIRAS
ncbi:MAG: hypothetical protein HY017_03365 [Betaproteobacteria bacterium]|nr:hypothetical protein [Betaproteobacteria bacterium]